MRFFSLQLLITLVAMMLFIHLPVSISHAAKGMDKTRVSITNDARVNQGEQIDSAVAVFGNVVVNGTVDQSAIAVFGDILVGPTGQIRNHAMTVFGLIRLDLGGSIIGITVQINSLASIIDLLPFNLIPTSFNGFAWLFKLLVLIVQFLLALIFVWLFRPTIAAGCLRFQQKPLAALLIGLAASLLIIPGIILLVITVLGILLIPFYLLFIFLAGVAGYLTAACSLGQLVIKIFKPAVTSILGPTILGLVVLWLLGWLPVAGSFIPGLMVLMGFGAVLFSLFSATPTSTE